MEIKRCEKGHFYDAQANSSCPQCAAEAAYSANEFETELGTNTFQKPMEYGKTEPVVQISEIGPTEPVMPFDEIQSIEPLVQTYDVQAAAQNQISPVVGWLVCIEGPSRGMDYRICEGYNNIGSGNDMDICIKGDNKIIADRHAQIAYDPREKAFFFGQALGKDIIRVNDAMVMMLQKLTAQDVLTIGSTKLLFIPLCTEEFDWND